MTWRWWVFTLAATPPAVVAGLAVGTLLTPVAGYVVAFGLAAVTAYALATISRRRS